jgi:Tfp pilus assembly protein PilF
MSILPAKSFRNTMLLALFALSGLSYTPATVAQDSRATTVEKRRELPEPLSPKDLFKLVSPSVFIVQAIAKDGSVIAFGSGVAVAPTRIVTNVHVIEGADSWRVRKGEKSWSATVANTDREHDLCELEVDGLRATSVVVRASSTIEVGERVYAIGTPEGLEVTLSDGLVSGVRDFDHSRVIQTTAAISKGSSGGGLFDSAGRLLGITTFFVRDGQNLNFALPAELIASLSSHPFEKAPKLESEDPVFQALVWRLAGYEFLSLKKPDRALNAFQQAVRIQPDFPGAWAGLGLAYEELGRDAEEAKAFEEAVRLQPDVAVYWYSLGLTYGRLRLLEQAFHAYKQAVALKPDYCEARFRLGGFYALKGERARVIETYKQLKTFGCEQAEEFFRRLVLPSGDGG